MNGVVPEFAQIAGDRWAHGGEDVDQMKAVLSKYIPDWEQYSSHKPLPVQI